MWRLRLIGGSAVERLDPGAVRPEMRRNPGREMMSITAIQLFPPPTADTIFASRSNSAGVSTINSRSTATPRPISTTTRIIGSGRHDFLTIRPGVVWDLPRALVLHSRGRWLAGFNLAFVFGPDGNTIGTGGRLRGELNLTHWFHGNLAANPFAAGSAQDY
jgi:hypothetical protein